MLRALGPRVHVGPAFDDDVESAVAALGEPTVGLPGGARLHVHPTPALVALDVDLGAGTAERQPKQVAQLAANTAIMPALARQIRLRNLGGAIVVDFGGVSARRRALLGPSLAAALARDPAAPRLLGFSALGLAEILRPRIHPPLHELLAGPHAAALAGLRAAEARGRADPGHAPRLACAPPVHAALMADGAARADFERRTGHPVAATSDPALGPPGWRLV